MQQAPSSRSSFTILLASCLLVVSLAACGSSSSSEEPNNPPVAAASAAPEVLTGSTVTLDGTQAADPDDDLVSFLWTLVSVPEGSTAALDDPAAARPTFVADLEGDYVASLTVSDGQLESEPAEVTVTATRDNTAPTADAGPDQSALVGDTIRLDASGSSDPDGDSLAYDWAFRSLPEGSTVSLSGTTGPSPSFTTDVEGIYEVRLIVNDGRVSSEADVMVITVTEGNMAPTADAGADFSAFVGEEAILDGHESFDPEGTTLTFAWEIRSRPEGSNAGLEGRDQEQAVLVPDREGTYVTDLLVSDGELWSEPSQVVVTAENAPDLRCAPEPNLIFCDSLDGSTTADRREGGAFVNGGWQAPGQLIWDLGRTLTQGRFEATLENWDPSSRSSQHRQSKAHILNMYEMSHASVHAGDDDDSSWFNVRTGPAYREMFKFYSSIAGFGDGNREETYHPPPNGRIDPSVPHKIVVEWGNRQIRFSVDGVQVGAHNHRTDMRLRYVVIGRDSSPSGDYGTQYDVIYKDIKVFSNQ